jgi:putative hemolysin
VAISWCTARGLKREKEKKERERERIICVAEDVKMICVDVKMRRCEDDI